MDSNTPSYVDRMRYGDRRQWDNTNYVSTPAYHQVYSHPAYHQPYSHPSEHIQHSNCLGTSSYSDAAAISQYSFSNPYCLTPYNAVPTTDACTGWQSASGTLPLGGYSSQGLEVNCEMAQGSSPLPDRRGATITHSTSHGSHIRPYNQCLQRQRLCHPKGSNRKRQFNSECFTTGNAYTSRMKGNKKKKASTLKLLKWQEEDPAAVKAGTEEKQRRNKDRSPASPSTLNETVVVESTPPLKQQQSSTRRRRAEVFEKKWPQIRKAMEILYNNAFSTLRQHSREQNFESSDLLGAWMPVMDCGVLTYYSSPPWWLGDIEYTMDIGELTEEARKRILQHLICGEHSLKVSLKTLEILRREMRAVYIHGGGRKALETAMAFHKWVLTTKNKD